MHAWVLLALMPGGDWPDFRAHGGIAFGKPPQTWSESQNLRWKTPISGRGWSSPVVQGGQIWTTTAPRDGKQLFAVCVNRETGVVTHNIKVFDVDFPKFCHPENTFASCTPALDDHHVYVHFGSYGTACLDRETGKIVWQRRDLPCDHHRGPASSPILFEDHLIVHFDGVDQQYVVALDKSSGATVCRKDRDIDFGAADGDFKKAYGTPLAIDGPAGPLLISPAATHTFAYNLRNAEEVWRVRHGGMNVAARPVFAHGLVFLTTGDMPSRLLAIRPDGRGDITDTHVVWRHQRHVPNRAAPIVVGDLLYMAGDDGFISCLEAKTGKEVWTERVGGRFWASPVAADGRVYFFDRQGGAVVIAAGRVFTLLARNRLDAGCWASPAVAGDDLIVRTETHLCRIGTK